MTRGRPPAHAPQSVWNVRHYLLLVQVVATGNESYIRRLAWDWGVKEEARLSDLVIEMSKFVVSNHDAEGME